MNTQDGPVYIPVRFQDHGAFDGRAALEQSGVKFHEICPTDPTRQQVELPSGWKIVRLIDIGLWQKIIDENENLVAIIVSPYGVDSLENAEIGVVARYGYVFCYNYPKKYLYATIYDNADKATPFSFGKELFRSDNFEMEYSDDPTKEEIEAAKERAEDLASSAAVAWLDENKPGWRTLRLYA